MFKKIIAILFLFILIFNIIGYKLIIAYYEFKSQTQMAGIIEAKKYAQEDLISLKIPVNLPYSPNNQDFENFEGNIDINGINYQYIKKRIYKDTLEVICIANYSKTYIQQSSKYIEKSNFDFSNSSKKSITNNIIKMSNFYFVNSTENNWYTNKIHIDFNELKNIHYSFNYIALIKKPPKNFSTISYFI